VPVSSVSDNEYTLPPLRQSEELRVQSSPLDEPVRAGCHSAVTPSVSGYSELTPSQRADHRRKVSAVSGAEESGDVLEDGPSSARESNNPHCFMEEPAPGLHAIGLESSAGTCHAHVLTWEAADHEIHRTDAREFDRADLRHVAEVRHIGIVMREHAARERRHLGERGRFPAEGMPRDASGFDAAEEGEEPHPRTILLSQLPTARHSTPASLRSTCCDSMGREQKRHVQRGAPLYGSTRASLGAVLSLRAARTRQAVATRQT